MSINEALQDVMQFRTQWPWLDAAIYLVALCLLALIVNFFVKHLLLRGLDRLAARTPWGRDPEVTSHGVIERLAMAAPAIVIALGLGLAPHLPAAFVTVARNVAQAVIILAVATALSSAVNMLDVLYHRRPEARLKPLKGYLQVLKIAIYVIAAVLMVATIIDRSPLILLSGLGAMAAVLILVFQDTLLSLVAGIQISSTDMVRVGDWIEVPGEGADGDVIEIALHTVKVQNFDRTITTVPIRKLVSGAFRNYRGMRESGGRRIKRAIFIDQTSIGFLTDQDVARLSGFALLTDYLTRKRKEIDEWNARLGAMGQMPANRRRLTNIGAFRAYVEAYMRANPNVRKDMALMVRQMPPGPEGLPLEVYCFANTVVWTEYEAIQSDLFDHLLAIVPEFGLRVFQNPSGGDVRALARAAT